MITLGAAAMYALKRWYGWIMGKVVIGPTMR